MASKSKRPAMGTPSSTTGLQVIILGRTGGPCEDNVTGMLVRSTATAWRPDSVIAVDAGVLVSGLAYVLKEHGHHQPFASMEMPYKTAKMNAAHIIRESVRSVLVTHAHLDHISGFVINTTTFEAPKRLRALPGVINAFKEHIFNGILWPNLTNEDGGTGLVALDRLIESGHIGSDKRVYIRACEGLLAQCFAVSHGQSSQKQQVHSATPLATPSVDPAFLSGAPDPTLLHSPSPALTQAQAFQALASEAQVSQTQASQSPTIVRQTVESSAFLIMEEASRKEIIVFGDVEPDSISAKPRNRIVWEMAAPKIGSKSLRAIFIECSFDDSVSDDKLYGHLCPRHLVAELRVLGELVNAWHEEERERKRKRSPPLTTEEISKKLMPPPARGERSSPRLNRPLDGLAIYLIHIKEDLQHDEGDATPKRILSQVRKLVDKEKLGCTISLAARGHNIMI